MPPASARAACALLLIAALTPLGVQADWRDRLRELQQNLSGAGEVSPLPAAGLSEAQIIAGLREALLTGARRATGRLSQTNGFLDNPRLRIPLPASLARVETLLRQLKQEQLADELAATLNHAAERAVGEGFDVFATAIRGMSWEDAADILQGPDDAATRYFQERTRAPLTERMLSIVRSATEAAGVTRAYKRVVDKVGFLTRYLKPEEVDLDGYVTQRALDGLFHELAAEEQRIREDPLARSSELLRQVFGR